MKTLKQIREEYGSVSRPSEDLIVEADDRIKSIIPGAKEMPAMLMFRRITYRVYPKKQVVALYYSKMVDKYLSIPFGPGGNLNVSESVIYDTLEEACWKGYEQYGMKKKGGKRVPNCVPVKEDKKTKGETYPSGETERGIYERFNSNLERIREERLEEGLASTLDAGAEALVPYYSAGKKAIKGDWSGAAKDAAVDTALMATTGGIGKLGVGAAKLATKAVAKGGVGRAIEKGVAKIGGKSGLKTFRSVKSGAGKLASGVGKVAGAMAAKSGQNDGQGAGESGGRTVGGFNYEPALKAKTGSAKPSKPMQAQQQTNENKMSDIRKMIKEGIEHFDLEINGRQVTLNTSMAKRILEVYDSVNTKNKRIVEGMLNEDMESFKKLLNFSIRN